MNTDHTSPKQPTNIRIIKLEDGFADEVLLCGVQKFKATNTTEAVKALCRFALSKLTARQKDSPAVPDGHSANTPNSSSQGGDGNGNTV